MQNLIGSSMAKGLLAFGEVIISNVHTSFSVDGFTKEQFHEMNNAIWVGICGLKSWLKMGALSTIFLKEKHEIKKNLWF